MRVNSFEVAPIFLLSKMINLRLPRVGLYGDKDIANIEKAENTDIAKANQT